MKSAFVELSSPEPQNLLPASILPKSVIRDGEYGERGRYSKLYPDLNISKVARMIKCGQSNLSNIMHGKKNGNPKLLNKIAAALGISLEELQRIRHEASLLRR